jgi:hypothetical protein
MIATDDHQLISTVDENRQCGAKLERAIMGFD